MLAWSSPAREQEAVEAASRGTRNVAQLSQQSLPPIRLQVVKVASEVRRGEGRCWCQLLVWQA